MQQDLIIEFQEALKEFFCTEEFNQIAQISKGETKALMCIGFCGSMSPTELSEELNVTRQRITSVITNLTKKGLIESVPDENDRRKTLLCLTEEGQRLCNIKDGYANKMFKQVVERLGEDDIRTIIRMTKLAVEIIREVNKNYPNIKEVLK